MVVTFRAAAIAVSLAVALPAAHAAVTPINQVQGDDLASPLAGQTVTVDGIVTGRTVDGFFLQSLPAHDDGNPLTSEGLFIHTGSAPDEEIFVGDRVRATGRIEELVANPDELPLTRMTGTPVIEPVQFGLPLPAPVPLSATDFAPGAPVDLAERWEGMRVTAQVEVVDSTGGGIDQQTGAGQPDGIFHVVIGTPQPYREAGLAILDPTPIPAGKTPAIWDMNAEKLRVDSSALGGPALRPWDRQAWYGMDSVMHYADGRYTLLTVPGNPWPLQQAPFPARPPYGPGRGAELTIVRVDLGGLWDGVDDPTRDEPVPSAEVIQMRMSKLNHALCYWMSRPDIIAFTGVESTAALDRFVDFVNEMAPWYNGCLGSFTGFTAEGTSVDGLDLGVLVRTSFGDARRILLRSSQVLATTATLTAPDGSKSPLFARPPQLYGIRTRGYDEVTNVDVTVLNVDIEPYASLASFAPAGHGWENASHEASIRRREQARWMASWLQSRQVQYPQEALTVVGGFEASEAGDGRVDVFGAISGREQDAAQFLWPVERKISRPLHSIRREGPDHYDPTAIVDGDRIRLDHILASEGLLGQAAVGPLYPRVNLGYPTIWAAETNAFPYGFSAREPVVMAMLFPALLTSDLSVHFGLPALASNSTELRRQIGVQNHGPTDAYLNELHIEADLPPGTFEVSDHNSYWTCAGATKTANGSRIVCTAYGLAADAEHIGYSYVDLIVPPNPALEDAEPTFLVSVHTGFAERDYRNDFVRQKVRFSSDVDVQVRAFPSGAAVAPGEEVHLGFGVSNPSENSIGTLTLTHVVSAPVADTAIEFGNGDLACTGVDVSGGSRWTCVGQAGRELDAANGWVRVQTRAGDAGRLVTLVSRVRSSAEDFDLENNKASTSVRIGGNLFDAATLVTAKKPIPTGATSSIPVATYFTGTPPSPQPMRLRVTATSAQPLQSVQFAPPGWNCVRGGTATAVAFDCTATTGTPPTASTLPLRLWPKFTQGGTDRVIVRAEYSHPLAGDSNPWNNVGQAVVAIAPATTGTAPAPAPATPAPKAPTAPAAPRTGDAQRTE